MSEGVRVEIVQFDSKLLAGNPLGDPATRPLPVLLPPGYEGSGSRRYPVLYGLAGFTGRGASMLNVDPWQPNLAERLDQLYAQGMPHAIVVLPDCFTALGGSQYVNSSATGPYEDYVVDEIVGYVDAKYQTIASPGGRGVFGKSSGGYGAMTLGMKHPDVFGALACHSGDMYFELCYEPDFPKTCDALDRAGGFEAWWERFRGRVKKTGEDMDALNIICMSACYSPATDRFLGIDLPFEMHTCRLRDDVWARWLEKDPAFMAGRYADNLKRYRLVYMDCGTRDEFNLHFGARILSDTLNQLGVRHTYEEFEDGHMSVQYRYSDSLPRLVAALDRE